MHELESALDALDIGVVILDEQHRIVGWNEWIGRASGRSKASAVGKPLLEIFPSLRETRVASAIEDAFEFGSSSILTYALNKLLPLTTDGGHELLHNLLVRPVAIGGSSRCLLQVNDVTVAVTRERVLRERQNARYRAIVDTAPDAIITLGADGTVQWINSAAEGIFGYAPSDLFGRPVAILLDQSDDLSGLLSLENPEFLPDTPAKEIVGRRKDGTSAWFEVSFAHWKADGRNFVTSIWRDVSERRAADEALRESESRYRGLSEELESRVAERTREREIALSQLHESQKMETIGQLTGGVAHDFNNLLAVILGSLSLLKKAVPSSPRVTQLIDSAIQGAERGATLTKRLLAFARRQELTLEVVDIRQLVPDMLDFLRQSLGPSINIEIDIPADLHRVKVDANQLELALMNLAVNARDAMPAGGTLSITCADEIRGRHALPATLPPGDFVRLSVADTGEGMSEETLAKAMEPFFTTKGVGKGTGLGLSMVQGLAAQTGGATHIASKLGQGTTVTLWLPRVESDEAETVSLQSVTVPSSKTGAVLSILLVDDDPLISMNTAYMLMDLGHKVYEASSAMQALELFDAHKDIDVVVTDYAMPNMSGLDLAKRLRVLNPKLPVVLATGYAELPPGEEVTMVRLNKPYTQEQLGESLLAVMHGRMSQ